MDAFWASLKTSLEDSIIVIRPPTYKVSEQCWAGALV